MKFIIYNNALDFEEKTKPILSKGEDVYSLFFGILQAIKAGQYENPFMATIEESGKVLALFQMTPPYPLNLIFVDEHRLEECLDLLIENLLDLSIDIPSIISSKPWAYRFAEKWKTETGMTAKVMMDQGLYRLDKVDEYLDKSPGTFRLAEEADCLLIESWYHLFEEDAGLPISAAEDVKRRVGLFIENREVFLWVHEGKVVSMMKKSRPTKRGVTVGLVFTPREERRKGYARTMVAACSKELLKDFEFCVLYTDMMNPTSNKIYKEIGYKKIVNSVQLGFVGS